MEKSHLGTMLVGLLIVGLIGSSAAAVSVPLLFCEGLLPARIDGYVIKSAYVVYESSDVNSLYSWQYYEISASVISPEGDEFLVDQWVNLNQYPIRSLQDFFNLPSTTVVSRGTWFLNTYINKGLPLNGRYVDFYICSIDSRVHYYVR